MADEQKSTRVSPTWYGVLKTLREARGLTQDGWALALGVGRATVQRWESGAAVPNGEAERSLIALCQERGLFRSYTSGPLRGLDLTPALFRAMLEEARLGLHPDAGGDAFDRLADADQSHRLPQLLGSATPALPPSVLPAAVSSFAGREQELAQVERLLGRSRLITLTGPGGSGKTRLALEAVARQTVFSDGIYFVDLAAVAEPELLVSAIAQTLQIHGAGSRPAADVLKVRLAERRLLLILDNFEHLAAAAPAVSELLTLCPRLSVLVTSREPLHLRGEQELAVPPLPTPETDRVHSVEQLLTYAAVALFVQRTRAVDPGFVLSEANSLAVARICQRLDGLPLAIELAAARCKVLSPAALLARLDQRLPMLSAGSRDLPVRQRTLRTTISWSYELLAPLERILFERLAVFAGGFGLEVAETVCSGDGIETPLVIELLSQLVDKSLVVVEHPEGLVRYRLLETIREYGFEKLQTSGKATAVAERLVSWCLLLAEQPSSGTIKPRAHREWLLQLDREHDSFRTALAWCLHDGGQPETGLRLAAAMGPFWNERGYIVEGLSWLKQLLNVADQAPAEVRAAALEQAGVLVWESADLERAAAWLEESRAIFTSLGAKSHRASTSIALGRLAMIRGDLAGSMRLFAESLSLYRELGDQRGIADALGRMGSTALLRGELDRAEALSGESLALHRQDENPRGIFVALCALVQVATSRRDNQRAETLHREAQRIAREEGMDRELAGLLIDAGLLANQLGEPEQAAAYQRESVMLYRKLGIPIGVVTSMTALAETLLRMGQAERAAKMLGSTEALRESLGMDLFPAARLTCQRLIETARALLGDAAFASALAVGRAQALDAAISAALAVES